MSTADERLAKDWLSLMEFASKLADTWTNGNKTEVYLAVESAPYRDAPALALLVSSYLDNNLGSTHYAATSLARALHQRQWEA